MNRKPKLWGLHARPGTWLSRVLLAVPFVVLISAYLLGSHYRRLENEHDKLLPSVSKMVASVERIAFTRDKRKDEYLMLTDTVSSLRRIGIGMTCSAVVGLLLGLNMGMFRGFEKLSLAFITFLSIVPPLALLPILFIAFGVGEFAKIFLIFLGTFPMITRDVYLATSRIPREQITKSLTLGASSLQVVYKIVFPQILPRLLDTVRLSMGAAWLFLIASEAIASTDGLGYRIFLVRRYLAMDIIIPYALWITSLGYLCDLLLRKTVSFFFPWYIAQKEA